MGMGRAGLLYAELSRADALARQVAHLAPMGKSSAALRGTISAVRMAEKLQLLRPTVGPIHWAIAAGAGRANNSEPGQQVWGTLGMLRAIATAVRTETDLAVLALAVFSACHGLRVGEAASIRRVDVSQPGWVSFYARKTKRRWIPARLGTWAERWRQALLACGVVQRRAEFLPLFSEVELERRMHCLLWGTPWVGVGWHCWRRLSAAAMVALGAPITAVCVWNRWASQRQAWEYAVPGPDWEFKLPDQAPWPHPVAGVTTLPLSSVQFWPAGALGRRTAPDASGAPIIIMVDSDDEGGDIDDGELGAPGTHRGMAQRGRQGRARHQDDQQQATPAPRARTTPPAQAQGPPVQQRCYVRRSRSARDGTSRKRKPSADAAALTAPGEGQGQLAPPPERLSKVRKAGQ